jgi:hypothetical protein
MRRRWMTAFSLAVLSMLPAIPGATDQAHAAPANLVPNPGFETGTEGWWRYNVSAAWSTTGWSEAGSRSMQVIGSSPSAEGDYVAVGTEEIPVRAGTSYTATARVNSLVIPPGEETNLQLFWRDGEGRGVGNSYASTPYLGERELTLTAQAPATAAYGQVRLFSYSRQGQRWNTYVDEIRMTQSSPTQSPLRWRRPTLVNPETISLGNGYTETKLDPERDYIVKLPPWKKVGGTTLIGGHNVVVVGGWISVPPGAVYDAERRGIYIKDATGTVHVEGVLIDGSAGGDFDGVAIAAPEATVQLQNMRIVGVRGSYDGFHGDIVQPWGGVRALRIDRLTGTGNYQGLMLAPTLGAIGSAELSNIDITTTWSPEPREHAGGHMLWLTEGTSCVAYPVTLDEVYIRPRSDRPLENAVWPPGNSSQQCKAVGDGTVEWPLLPISGEVLMGPPPGGNFVPPGAAGVGYVSPG